MTITKIKSDLPMRIGVGVILLNNKNEVFVGKRRDNQPPFAGAVESFIEFSYPYEISLKHSLAPKPCATSGLAVLCG